MRTHQNEVHNQLNHAQKLAEESSHAHCQSLDKLKIEAFQIRSNHENELSVLRGQLHVAQQEKRAAEEKLAREMESMQLALNSMQNQGRNEEVWKGRCLSMKSELEALRSDRDSLTQQLQAQRLNYNNPQVAPPSNNQRPRPALAISTATNHPTNANNNSYQAKQNNGRMY